MRVRGEVALDSSPCGSGVGVKIEVGVGLGGGVEVISQRAHLNTVSGARSLPASAARALRPARRVAAT